MASKNEAKVTFTAETADLNKAISSANSELTKLRSELKLNEAQAKGTGESMDSLKDRARILGDEYAASQSKVDALSAKLESAKSIFGENSIEAQKLETQLNNARVAQERISQQINQTNSAMQAMEDASSQAGSALGRLGDEVSAQESELASLKRRYNEVASEQGESSAEARQLAAQISKTSSELQDNRSRLEQASTAADQFDRSLDGVGDAAREAGSDLDAMDFALGDFISDTAQSAISTMAEFEEGTRESRNETNKMVAVAQETGQSLDGLTDAYNTLYSVTGDGTLSSTAVLNMSAMGASVEDQQRIVNAAAGAWAAYGDSIPIDGLLEAVNETVRTRTVTGGMADALNWANVSLDEWKDGLKGSTDAIEQFTAWVADGNTAEDAFNEALLYCNDSAEAQEFVISALETAYGGLGSTYQEVNADVMAANDASNKLSSAQASLGAAIAPVSTAMTELKAGALQWIADNLPIVTPLVTGLATAFGGFLVINNVIPAIQGVVSGMQAATVAIGGLNVPIVLIIGAIAALAAGLIALWNNNETFRNGVMSAWNAIVAFLTPIIAQIQTTFQTYWPVIQQAVTDVMTAIQTAIQTAWPIIQQAFQTACSAIQSVIDTVWPVVRDTVTSVMENVQGVIETAWPAIQGVIESVMDAVQAFIDNVWPHIQSAIETAMGAIQKVIEVAWPIIQNVFQTAGAVIQTIIDTVFPAIKGTIDTVMGVIQGIIQTVTGIISGDWSQVWEGISQVASSIWNGISSTIGGIIEGISSNIGSVIDGISSTIGSVFNGISSTVSSIWNGIKDTIGGAINGAKDLVGNAIDAIKGFFNFKFEWPHIPLPHFSISGSINPLDWFSQGLPKISVSWYAEGGIMDSPTIFGVAGGSLLGGGEAGPEAIAPIDKLQAYVQDAVDSRLGGLGDLVSAIERLADREISIEISGREVARTTAADADRVNGSRQRLVNRGVSLA